MFVRIKSHIFVYYTAQFYTIFNNNNKILFNRFSDIVTCSCEFKFDMSIVRTIICYFKADWIITFSFTITTEVFAKIYIICDKLNKGSIFQFITHFKVEPDISCITPVIANSWP